MTSPGLLTTRAELEGLFDELAEELDRRSLTAEIVMVGGSWMLWHSQRAATQDVDSAERIPNEVRPTIEDVGARHDLPATWLNDAAAPFWPTGASFDDCAVVFRRPSLVVRTPSPDVIFVMKLYRADPQDREDMVLLWPLCAFDTPEAATLAYIAGFPHAPEDEYLTSYISDIVRESLRP